MKILVADDESTSRLIAETALRELGHECFTCSNGAQAWDIYRSQGPEVVMSDWMMPGLSGLELCRNIRADATAGYTYFILITGRGGRDQIVEGMRAGADDYLVKPLDPEDLEMRLISAARVTSLHVQLAQQRIQLEGLNHELSAVALSDPLTGLGNRRSLDEDLELLEARVTRYGHRYCMAIFDVDHFKAYNDTYGHQAGDQILQVVASQIRAQARGGDSVYRYGGEEFLCIFPEQTLSAAMIVTQRMRTGLERQAVPHSGASFGVLTISAGLAMLDPGHLRSADEVLKEADDALYRAKLLGRNRVEHAFLQPVIEAAL